MTETVLVTGGAGFIGSCFIRQLLQQFPQTLIVNLDKLTYAATTTSVPKVPATRYRLVKGDIGDSSLVSKLLTEYQPRWVVNFAAESHVDRSIDHPDEFVMTNVVGTYRLLDSTLLWWQDLPEDRQRTFRLLHVSTDEVYGSLGASGLFLESTPYAPSSPYSASKAAADHFVRAYHHTYGLPVLTSLSSNNYGPYQFPEKLIPLMALKAAVGAPLPVYGTGRNVRDWLHVEDHCRALQRVLESGEVGQVYNVGGDSQRTNLQVVQTICDTLDELLGVPHSGSRRNLIEFVSDRPGHDWRYAIDCSRIKQQLGWSAERTFEAGLRETLVWYIDNPQWIEAARSGQDTGQRLGAGRT